MKERPILMSGPMVRAILEGRKTQTRRVVKPQPHESTTAFRDIPDTDNWYGAISTKNDLGEAFYPNPAHGDFRWRCPYGKPGDRLWVRETCYIWGRWNKTGFTKAGKQKWRFKVEARSITFDPSHPQIARKTTPRERCMYWRRNSIHMPRWASRILLEITDVRVQRLQEISEEDAIAEGLKIEPDGSYQVGSDELGPIFCKSPITAYGRLWDSIHGEMAWFENPWVWAITFKRVETSN